MYIIGVFGSNKQKKNKKEKNIMKQLIKTNSLIDNPVSWGVQKSNPMYILPKEEKEAEELFKEGKKVYATVPVIDGKTLEKTFHRQLLSSLAAIHSAYDGGYVCGVKMPLNKLLDEEYNVLQVLGTRSHMDSWFWLIEKDGKDMVRDLEADGYKIMALRNALPIFAEGLLDLNHYGLTEEEKKVAYQLFDRFGIEFKPV
jgi:hypothetical protein